VLLFLLLGKRKSKTLYTAGELGQTSIRENSLGDVQ